MIFGNNYLSLTHKQTKFSLKFHPIEALELVDTTGNNNLKVSYAKEWAKER
jgi:type 2A phosphatase activator TIP41